MISNVRLSQIHLRLNQIFNPKDGNSTFGGKNILFFGDLLQVGKYHNIFKFKYI